jgi:hypothetical protein
LLRRGDGEPVELQTVTALAHLISIARDIPMGELHGGAIVVVVVLVARMTCRRAGEEVAEGNGLNGDGCSAIAAPRSQGCPGLLAGKEGEALAQPWGTTPAQLRLRAGVGWVLEAQLARGRGGCPERDEGLVRGNERAGCNAKAFALCV